MDTYKVFTRSARNFAEFARAKKRTVARGLSYDEARRYCQRENANLSAQQIARGTKHEFTKE